ncbi:MAG: exodeoxyribonuclease VII small subunit [Candidatus Berkelbacteria bacterium]
MPEENSFASKMEELEKIKAKFESGNFDLEKDLPLYKKAVALAKELKGHLKKIENEIIEIEQKDSDLVE